MIDHYNNVYDAGWSSPVAREAHNLEVAGSNPVPATFSKSLPNLELRYLPMVGSAARLIPENPVNYRILEKRGRTHVNSSAI